MQKHRRRPKQLKPQTLELNTRKPKPYGGEGGVQGVGFGV